MRAFAAIVALTVTTIITIGGAWICRGEFGIGPEWVLPILLAFVLPIQEKEQDDELASRRGLPGAAGRRTQRQDHQSAHREHETAR